MNEFVKPTIEYAELSPLLVVFGVACVGVLVEAFAPRRVRFVSQSVLAGAGLVAALVGTILVAIDLPVLKDADGDRRRPGPDRRDGHDRHRRSRRLHVGPDPRLRPLRRPALRRAPPRGRRLGVRRPGGRAARHRGGAPGVDARPRAHRGLPAADVRGRRHDAVPGVQRPAHHVRRARGALAAAVPALRARPSAPAAQPGGGAEVLPARRVLLRLLPLRRRPGLRLRRLDGLLRHQRGGPQRREQPGPAARRHGPAVGRPAVQGRRGAVPVLDARRLPGRARPR